MLSTQDQILHHTLQWCSANPHHTPYYAAMEKALERNAAQILKKKKCFEQLKQVHLSLTKTPQAQEYNLEPYQTPPPLLSPDISTISMTHWNPIIVDGGSYQNSSLDHHHVILITQPQCRTPPLDAVPPIPSSSTNTACIKRRLDHVLQRMVHKPASADHP